MAKTYSKGQLKVAMPNDAALGVLALYLPEAASQTALNGSPFIFSSGYLTVATEPVEAVAAFSLEDAHNGATDGLYKLKICPAYQGLHAWGNLLTTAGADNVLAASDLGADVQLVFTTPYWHFGDSASNPCFQIVQFKPDPEFIPPNQSETEAVAGDTNARVLGSMHNSAAVWAD